MTAVASKFKPSDNSIDQTPSTHLLGEDLLNVFKGPVPVSDSSSKTLVDLQQFLSKLDEDAARAAQKAESIAKAIEF